MKRVAVLAVAGLLAIVFGPVAFQILVYDLPQEIRERRNAAVQRRRQEQNPGPISQEAEPLIRAAGARTIHVYRLGQLRGSCWGESDECIAGYRVLREVQVDSMAWGRRFLTDLARMGTVSLGEEDIVPDCGIRFVEAKDTTLVLLEVPHGSFTAKLLLLWIDDGGFRRRLQARSDFRYEGDPTADSTLQRLRHSPPRL